MSSPAERLLSVAVCWQCVPLVVSSSTLCLCVIDSCFAETVRRHVVTCWETTISRCVLTVCTASSVVVNTVSVCDWQLLRGDRQKACRHLLRDYYQSLCKHLLQDCKELCGVEKHNRRILQVGTTSAVPVTPRLTHAHVFDDPFSGTTRVTKGDSIAEWLACWTQAQKGLGSNRSRKAVG